MRYGTMKMDGKIFVLVPELDFKELSKRVPLPAYPAVNKGGNLPALVASRVSIARTIIGRMEALNLTQRALAAAAELRVETINRVLKGKVSPDTATLLKIDKALTKAEKREWVAAKH